MAGDVKVRPPLKQIDRNHAVSFWLNADVLLFPPNASNCWNKGRGDIIFSKFTRIHKKTRLTMVSFTRKAFGWTFG